jgi:hypothetical protein
MQAIPRLWMTDRLRTATRAFPAPRLVVSRQRLHALTMRKRLHTPPRLPRAPRPASQSWGADNPMSRVLLTLILGAVLTGCASLGVRTEGTSGPLAWHVTDLKSEAVPGLRGTTGDAHGTYSFTLILQETHGMPLTFTYRKDTIYASSLTILQSADQAIHLRFRPHQERRFPLTFSWGCPAGDCLQVENVAPRWAITLTGSDDKGNAVKAVIDIILPANPETSQKS